MCKHKYNDEFITTDVCEWTAFYADIFNSTRIKNIEYTNLPLDNDGICIFHSTDLSWKRENNCLERLSELVYLLNNDGEEETEAISFVDFTIVGNKSADIPQIKDNNIHFKNILCSRHLVLQNVKFIDAVVINRCYFKHDIIIENCSFDNNVEINNLTVRCDLHINMTTFNKNLALDNQNSIYGNTTITASHFLGDANFNSLYLYDRCHIENNIFEHDSYYTNFNCLFDGGLEFANNVFFSLCFDNCRFNSDCSIFNIQQKNSFLFIKPHIEGSLSFVGTEESLLFNPLTNLEITPDCFGKKGHVIFEYCNILNLGNVFIDSWSDLESRQLIKVSPTCMVDRLIVSYEYSPYTNLTSNIIEDFVHLITRYFSHWHSINLTVSVLRERKKSLIKVIFKTADKISLKQFKNRLKKFHGDLSRKNNNDVAEIDDMKMSYNDILKRISFQRDHIDANLASEILTLQDNITININQITISSMGDTKFNIDKSQIGSIVTGNNNKIHYKSHIQNYNEQGLIDFDEILKELIILKAALKDKASTNDNDKDIILVENAEKAARNGDADKVITNLKKVSIWAYRIAKLIGIEFIGAIIGNQMTME